MYCNNPNNICYVQYMRTYISKNSYNRNYQSLSPGHVCGQMTSYNYHKYVPPCLMVMC